MTDRPVGARHHPPQLIGNPIRSMKETDMNKLNDFLAGLVFTAVIALVVGGTTAMLVQPSVLFA